MINVGRKDLQDVLQKINSLYLFLQVDKKKTNNMIDK